MRNYAVNNNRRLGRKTGSCRDGVIVNQEGKYERTNSKCRSTGGNSCKSGK